MPKDNQYGEYETARRRGNPPNGKYSAVASRKASSGPGEEWDGGAALTLTYRGAPLSF